MNNNANIPLSSDKTPTMILEPGKWANEMQELAADYVGLPESSIFLTAARRYRALAAQLNLPPQTLDEVDGFVVGGDIT